MTAAFEVNFEMIQREEKITATYLLNSRKARFHEIHPQGQLSLDVNNPEDFILEADGAIDFFQRLEINASTTATWEIDGIDSIAIQLRYGPMDDGTFRRTADILLKPDADEGTSTFNVERENDEDSRPAVYWYEYFVTVHYKPDVALGEQQGAFTSVGAEDANAEGWIRSTSRNLVVHPRDVTPAVIVSIGTGVMRFELIERVQVALTYGPYRQNLILSPDSGEHRVVIRPEEGVDATLRTEGTVFFKDGAQVPLPLAEWSPQELVFINEPRDNILRVMVILADPNGEFERVQVRLFYEQDNRTVENQYELTAHAQIEQWEVRLEDTEARDWRYEATIVGANGSVTTLQEPGVGSQLVLGVQAVDVIPVHVTWLTPIEASGLLAVKIDFEYEDDRNDLQYSHSQLLREGDELRFKWSIPIKNEDLRTYRYRVTEFRSTGQVEGEWRETTDTELVLLPGG